MAFGWQLTLWLVLALLVALGAGFLLWWGLGSPDFRGGTLNPRERLELIKIALAVTGGIGGVVALVVAYRRQQLNEAEHLRDATKLFNERYASAVDQLGSDKAAIRLGGVYAMAGLADDWEAGRQKCIDVLCAYLRMPYTPPVDPDDDEARQAAGIEDKATWSKEQGRRSEERQVRHTVVRLIRDHLRDSASGKPGLWCGHDFDFTGAVFDGGDFSKAVFSSGTVNFTNATFSGGTVNFYDATFSGGTVTFIGAAFSGGTVSFAYAAFSGGTVNFYDATFSGGTVNFTYTTFSGSTANFTYTTFSGSTVHFTYTTFSGSTVHFTYTTFSGSTVHFSTATFSGSEVDFSDTTFSGGEVTFTYTTFSGSTANFTNATFSGSTVGFVGAKFTDGTVDFDGAIFSGGKVTFGGANFSGGTVTFYDAEFSSGMVNFHDANFSGSNVSFAYAAFSGGTVNFASATFSGGTVDLSRPTRFDKPPIFDAWEDGPPEGLLLPPTLLTGNEPEDEAPHTAKPNSAQ